MNVSLLPPLLDSGNQLLKFIVKNRSERESAGCAAEVRLFEELEMFLVALVLSGELLVEKTLLEIKLLLQKLSLVTVIEAHSDPRTNQRTENRASNT